MKNVKALVENVTLASAEEVEAVGALYDSVNEYFEQTTNYCWPNWRKGYYPTTADAQNAFEKKGLYVLKLDSAIAGSVILDHRQHPEYKKISWNFKGTDSEVMVFHTLVVDPEYRKCGIGEALVRFSMNFGRKAGAGAMRTDTHYQNLPARCLYTRCGFTSLGPWEAFIENRDQKFDVFEYLYGKNEKE